MDWMTAEKVFDGTCFRGSRWLGVEGGVIREVRDSPPPGGQPVKEFAGCAVFPGPVNTHSHTFHAMIRGCGADLSLLEWLHDVVYRCADGFSPSQTYWAAALAYGEMLKYGITTVVDFFYLNGRGNDYAEATIRAAEDVGIRLVLARTFMDWDSAPATIRETVAEAVGRYRDLAAACTNRRTVTICPAAHSLYAASLEMVRAAREAAAERGSNWHMHVADAAGSERLIRERYGKSTIQRLAELKLLDEHLVAVHAVYADQADVDLISERCVSVSHNPTANMYLGDGVAPIVSYLRRGVCVGLGTDSALDNNNANVFHEMKMAALVQKSVNADPQALRVAEVIRMATVNGARITELPVGRLEPGCSADFVVIDLSDLSLVPNDELETHIVYSLPDRAIKHVYVDGRAVVRDGRLTGIDETELVARIHAESRGMFDMLSRERCNS